MTRARRCIGLVATVMLASCGSRHEASPAPLGTLDRLDLDLSKCRSTANVYECPVSLRAPTCGCTSLIRITHHDQVIVSVRQELAHCDQNNVFPGALEDNLRPDSFEMFGKIDDAIAAERMAGGRNTAEVGPYQVDTSIREEQFAYGGVMTNQRTLSEWVSVAVAGAGPAYEAEDGLITFANPCFPKNPDSHPTVEVHELAPSIAATCDDEVASKPVIAIDRDKVTYAHYLACVDDHVCVQAWGMYTDRPESPKMEDDDGNPTSAIIRPRDAEAYCKWVGGRLATASEWKAGIEAKAFTPGSADDEWVYAAPRGDNGACRPRSPFQLDHFVAADKPIASVAQTFSTLATFRCAYPNDGP